jgi:hypothetical protein
LITLWLLVVLVVVAELTEPTMVVEVEQLVI